MRSRWPGLDKLGATLAVGLVVALARGASAQAVFTGPLPNPPPYGTNQTANLLFQAQLAVAQAAAANAQGARNGYDAQAAALSYQQAVQRYRSGDYSAARAAALQALMSANHVAPQPIPTISPLPPTSYAAAASRPFPLTGNIPQIDAEAFIAQARGAVAACVTAKSSNASAAQAQLAAAERANQARNYTAARAAARNAVDLCAAAQSTLSP